MDSQEVVLLISCHSDSRLFFCGVGRALSSFATDLSHFATDL